MSNRPLLVVLRALALGDLLTGLPALRALADGFPGHRRILAAPAWLEPLAALSGAVDELAPTRPLASLAPRLAAADVAVDLHGRGPESHRVLIGSKPRRLIAFANREVPESAGMPVWRADEHEVARWCRLLEESGIPADAGRLDLDRARLPVPEQARGATLIHPGAASPARRWPPQRFGAVARSELEAGRRVIVTGTTAERSLAREVASRAGLDSSAVYAGRTGLLELAGLVAIAGRVVCGDTGVAHLATALRTPSVVLFGPTSPRHWGPPADRPWHRALWAGSRGNPHGREPDRGLLRLRIEDVRAALAELDVEEAVA